MADKRPLGITVLATLGFISGIFGMLGGIIAMFVLPSFYGAYGVAGGIAGAMAAGRAVGAAIHGIITVVCAWGLWTGKNWAWWLVMIFSGLSVLSILALNIVGAVIGAIFLWYFLKPHVKDYFGVKVEYST